MGNESKKRSSDARDSHYVATNNERDTMKLAPQNITNRRASNNPAGNHRNREFDRVKSAGDAEPELIRFAISQNSLGSVLVASSEKGVCAILLGDNAKALIAELRFRFPKAQLGGGNPEFKTSVAKVVRAIETPGSTLDIPLDLRERPFSSASGRLCAKSPWVRPRVIRKSPGKSGCPRPRKMSPKHAPRMLSPSLFPAIA